MRALANTAAAGDDPAAENALQPAGTLARLENEVGEGRVLTCLQRLQDQMTAGRWREAVRLLRASGARLGQVDPALPQRLGMVLYATMVRKGVPSVIGELAAIIKLPMDPHGNRGQAMAWEHSKDGNPDDVEPYWRAYVEDWPAWSVCRPRSAPWPSGLSGCASARCWARSRAPVAQRAAFATIRTKPCRARRSSASRTA